MTDLSSRIAGLSPEKQALLAMRLKKRHSADHGVEIPRRPDPGSYPLSYAQQRMWFLNQYEPESAFYNIFGALRLTGALNIPALTGALNAVIARHEPLRARYVTEKGYPRQIVAPELTLSLPETDLRELEPGQRQDMARQLAREEARRPFDLTQGPLIRSSLLRLDSREWWMLLTMHHIASDGWSMGVLVRELGGYYSSDVLGRSFSLPELPVQYADYAVWQREWLEGLENGQPLDGGLGEDGNARSPQQVQMTYWLQRLGYLPPILELPADRPRPPVQTYQGAHFHFQVAPSLVERLRSLGREEESTLFIVMLAAFKTLLYRYTGQEDLAVGSPVANRNRSELEPLIGFFVNTLVMRSDLSGNPTFRELLRRVRETALGAYANQDLPFELLLDALKPERDLSHTPLFQVVFNLQSDPLVDLSLPDLTVELLNVEPGTAKFDLLLLMEAEGDGLAGIFEYNTDLFERATIERMAGHFLKLLESICADANRSITDLPLLTETEARQLLIDWTDTRTEYPRESSLAQLFEAQVERSPEAVALVFNDTTLTYRELNRRANQVANYLQRLGVGPETLVGLFMERSIEMVVATLGIVKAGGAYLPLDLSYPPERIAFMLADAQAPVLITLSSYLEQLPTTVSNIICLDTLEEIELDRGQDPVCRSTADSLAYVIYTSGSTGLPKGVLIPQRAVTRLVFNTNYIEIGPSDRIAHASNPNFDAATFEIWGALLHGARLVIASLDTVLSTREFTHYLRENKISALFVTTALFNHIANEAPAAFQSVKTLMVGGEACDPQAVRTILLNGAPERLLNVYGPTESTTFATWYPVQQVPEGARTVPIGWPLSNTRLYILDNKLQPVPIGVVGELYLGGDGLARGYLNRPKLTAERFLELPIANCELPSDELKSAIRNLHRVYRTGDLARYLPDGAVEYVGRVDRQIKLRGFRIELGEIETVLSEHPQVSQAVVLMREDQPGVKRLAAYFVVKQAPALAADNASGDLQSPTDLVVELRRYLKSRLPEYMLPADFVLLDSLPVTPNGKVDRKALPVPDSTRLDAEKPLVEPRTALERYLARLWQGVLKVERIGIYDNFFEIGGDSLKAAVLINQLQEESGQSAHVRALFMAPTIAELSVYIQEYYPGLMARFKDTEPARPAAPLERLLSSAAADGRRITSADLENLQRIIHPLAPRASDQSGSMEKNPPAIFILSPPRSGSTLLRAMLAGNPRLFSPPELDLLSFNTLTERKAAFSGEYAFWLEGVVRAIMELKGCEAGEANRILAGLEARGVSVKDFYRQMQEWLGDRLLVDKTPVYSLDMEILKRAESDFQDPLYIHLVRHPYASIYSFIEAKLDGVFFRYPHPYNQRELAELVWILSHQNILTFLQSIPAERQMRLRFEDVLSRPEDVMRVLCRFAGVDFHAEMLNPYEGKRMTDGVEPGKQMVGDFKFYLRKRIDASAADRWKKFHHEDFLSEMGWKLGGTLGYHSEDQGAPAATSWRLGAITPVPRQGALPLSFAQQRLWFLDQWEPGSPFYNIPSAIRLTGTLDRTALERSVNEIVRRHEVLRTIFPTVDGRPGLATARVLEIPLPVVDLRDLPEEGRESEVRRLSKEEAQGPFDLARGPLLRVQLLRLGEEEHIFLLTLHHIIADGWSAGVIVRELAALYPAFAGGWPPSLPELDIQYVDYAAWQRGWLEGKDADPGSSPLQAQLDYWKARLGDMPQFLELPTDRPRPAVVTQRGARWLFTLPETLGERLKALSRREGVTLYMTLLAAFQALLGRYTGQEDFGVGTPVANRGRTEIEPLIGFFVNTLVLRADLSADPSFRELLRRVQHTAVEAYDHQDIPFEMLVDALQPERTMSHTPLFQVMFTLQESTLQALQLPGLTLLPLQPDTETAKFDLLLSLVERDNILRGALEFKTDLFDLETIQRLAGNYQNLLEALLAEPDAPLSRLPILGMAERGLLQAWNRTDYPVPYAAIPQLFAAQVARSPQARAVYYEGASLSYAGLNHRANQLARFLRREGVGPEVLVGLCLDRSLELVVGLLAILKAGGAYVALDPTYPAERLAYILDDANAPVVLTQQRLVDAEVFSGQASRRVICIDRDWERIAREADEDFDSGVAPESLAYVIYTSGSTGKPKGALIEHRSAVNLWAGLNQAIYTNHPGSALRISLNAPLAFDASVQQWIMLLSGHTLYVIPQDLRLDGQALLDYIRAHRLDVLDCVPSQLKLLLDAGLLDGQSWAPQAVLPGGEAIDAVTWQALVSSTGTQFYNMYGPTECTVDSTICWINRKADRPSIGRPIVNAHCFVLDRHRQLAPVGVPGELYIGGAGVGRGYHNRPDLTVERFVELGTREFEIRNDQEPEYSQLVYRTGDLVKWLPDGELEFLGRIDHQVKVRGFRIELGEIESVLRGHADLAEVAVIARAEPSGDRRLVAYVVAAPGVSLAEDGGEAAVQARSAFVARLREHCRKELPDYMIPPVFVLLERLPLLPNGKLDRNALDAQPVQEGVRPALDAAYTVPQSEDEAILASIWKSVLGLDRVGVQDNFFELGGDSILSIQVVARAKAAGLQLRPRQLFQYPTIAALAGVAGRAPAVTAATAQEPVTGPVPLTPIQRRFFAAGLPNPQHWNQAFLLESRQALDRGLLERSLEALLQYHDALRMRFHATETGWQALLTDPDGQLPFTWIDLSALPPDQQKEAVETRAAGLQASLDLEHGPLLQAAYFDLGGPRHGLLLLVIHHLVVDGISWRVLLEDLQAVYRQLSEDPTLETVTLPPKATSFQRWAERLSEYAQGPAVRSELEYWLSVAKEPGAVLPLDWPEGGNLEADATGVRVNLSADETHALLTELPSAYGTEINDALLAALVEVFSAWTGRPELLVDLEGHGREDLFPDIDLSRTLGWFTTLYPVRLVRRGKNTGERLQAVKEILRRVPNHGIGFGLLGELCQDEGVRHQLASLPAAQVSFNYLGQVDDGQDETASFTLAPESAGPSRNLDGQRAHILDINGSIFGGRLQLEWSYSQAQFRPETIVRLAEKYLESLRALIAYARQPGQVGYTPSDFPEAGLSQEEIAALLSEMNGD